MLNAHSKMCVFELKIWKKKKNPLYWARKEYLDELSLPLSIAHIYFESKSFQLLFLNVFVQCSSTNKKSHTQSWPQMNWKTQKLILKKRKPGERYISQSPIIVRATIFTSLQAKGFENRLHSRDGLLLYLSYKWSFHGICWVFLCPPCARIEWCTNAAPFTALYCTALNIALHWILHCTEYCTAFHWNNTCIKLHCSTTLQ